MSIEEETKRNPVSFGSSDITFEKVNSIFTFWTMKKKALVWFRVMPSITSKLVSEVCLYLQIFLDKTGIKSYRTNITFTKEGRKFRPTQSWQTLTKQSKPNQLVSYIALSSFAECIQRIRIFPTSIHVIILGKNQIVKKKKKKETLFFRTKNTILCFFLSFTL